MFVEKNSFFGVTLKIYFDVLVWIYNKAVRNRNTQNKLIFLKEVTQASVVLKHLFQ